MFIRRLMSGAAFWPEYLPPSLCLAEGDGDAAGGGDGGAAAGADGGGDAGAADTGAGADTGGSLRDLAEDTGGEPAAETEDDWRTTAAGGDEKLLRELKRYASPNTVAKALIEAKARIRQGLAPLALPENATEEQVAEYRKAIGVPETPDGYGVKFAPEVQADDRLNAMLQSFTAYAHEKNLPPAAVKAAVEWQQNEIIRQRDEQTAQYQRELGRTEDELRNEYRGEFERNIQILKEYLSSRPTYREFVLSNMHRKAVMKEAFEEALENAPIDILHSGDGRGGGKSLDERLDELTQKSIRGQLTKAEQDERIRLTEAQIKRDERNERRVA